MMNLKNGTTLAEIFFLGFPGPGEFKMIFFIFILLVYTLTVFLDIVIIRLVSVRKQLQTPMYFFLQHFFFSEMVTVTLIVPVMLHILWLDGAAITFAGCLVQNYFCVASGTSECYLLAAMSYDRYLAICKPLHYHKMMGNVLQCFLVVFCWIVGLLTACITLGLLMDLKFCGQNVIDNFICDHANLLDLACSDTSALRVEIFVMSFPTLVIPFILVIGSYVSVCIVILRLPSTTGRRKAFSTCSTHLMVVSMFYGPLIINYFMSVKGNSKTNNKMISAVFVAVIPFFSPIIYSLRNQDIHIAISQYIH